MFADLLDLVLPRRCVGCARPGPALCGSCAAVHLVRIEHGGVPIVAAAPYDAGLRTALLAYKERDRRDLARPLAALLSIAVAGVLVEAPVERRSAVLVPVPSTAAARRRRAGDHVRRIACAVPAAVVVPALRFTRSVRDSAGLSTDERAANLSGAMTARACGGRAAVLVDDITTTGATLAEAAGALRAAGWVVAGAAVVAATPRRVGPSSARSSSTRSPHR